MEIAHNIYIHVPFCVSKCNYCAFFSRACRNPNWDEYSDKIIDEVQYFAKMLGKIHVPTIFFGGGTPSIMPHRHFAKIMNEIRKCFDVAPDAEVTIEANPGTMDHLKLDEFCAAGITRLSIGVQSLDDKKLKFLGRIHTANAALELIDDAMQHDINVSADFIYGIPNDTVDDVIKTCQSINRIGLKHCSMYELTLEPNTPFAKMQMDMPGNDEMAEMYIAIGETLVPKRYEVSNYAVPGNWCRHNQNVWDGAPYIGIGDGAAGRVFFNNTWYEQMGGRKMFQPMDTNARAIERVITGMRTARGVQIDDAIKKILNLEFAKSHSNMIMFRDNRMVATDAGILVLDNLIEKLVI